MPTITFEELYQLKNFKNTRDKAFDVLLRYAKQLETSLEKNNLNRDGTAKNTSKKFVEKWK